MFLLPLGLQSRIVKWPIATLLIVVATCVVSIRYFSENAMYIRDLRQAMTGSHILEARKNLLISACDLKLDLTTCEFLRTNLSVQDVLTPQDFVKKFNQESSGASFTTSRKLSSWMSDIRIEKTLQNTPAAATPQYQAYTQAKNLYLKTSLEKAKKEHIFTRGNGQILAALKAMFTHDGWVHLISNVVIFALFAVFLEQRIGTIGLLLLYVLGGLGSNFLQLPFLPMGMRLLGASGALSTVIGAFAVYFWREKMRCLLSLGFVYNRMVYVPAWMYIGLFMILSDVIGMIGASDGIAHLAHLTGFGIGFIFAYMQMDLFPLKKGFLFGQEQKLYYQVKQARGFTEKMELIRRIYSLNRESFYAYRGLFLYFNKQNLQIAAFNKEDREFISELIRSCIAYKEKGDRQHFAGEILSSLPLSWDLTSLNLKLNPTEILDRANDFHSGGDLILTLRFYDLFFTKYAAHARFQEIQSEVMKIFDTIERFDGDIKAQILDGLKVYADHHPQNHFQTQIRNLMQQVMREAQDAAG